MKKINLFKRPTLNFNVGVRLFCMGVFLMLGMAANQIGAGFILAGIAALWPARNSGKVLATGLTAEQELAQIKFLDKVKDEAKKILDEANKGLITPTQLEARIEKFNTEVLKLSNKEIEDLKKTVDEYNKKNAELQKKLEEVTTALGVQSGELKKIADNAGKQGGSKGVDFKGALKEAFLGKKEVYKETTNADGDKTFSMKDYFEGSSDKKVSYTVKVAVDMLQSNIVGTGVNEYRLTDLDPQRVSIPLAVYPHVTDVFMVKNMSKPYMALLVVYDYQDGADTKAEGVASGKSSFLFKTVLFKAFYIATHFKISDETLDDIDEVIDEIAAIGPDKILSAVDRKVLGTTGDDVTDIKGIRTTGSTGKSTAFVASTVPDTPDAKFADLIMGMKLQAENAGYKPNLVIIPPSQEYLLGAEKDLDENSRQDRRIAYDSFGRASFIGGLRIITNDGIPDNQTLVLDNKLAWIGRRKDMTMEIGYDGNDLTEGMKTVVIKIRIAFGVRDKAGVIWTSAVDNMIAQITAS